MVAHTVERRDAIAAVDQAWRVRHLVEALVASAYLFFGINPALPQTPLQRAAKSAAKKMDDLLHFGHMQQKSAAKKRRCTKRDRSEQHA